MELKLQLQAGDTLPIPEGCKAIVKDRCIEIEKIQDFKDGDILVTIEKERRCCIFIYKETDDYGFHSFYIGINTGDTLTISKSPSQRWGNDSLLDYATEKEKRLLFDKMKELGLRWNVEEKRVEQIRWRAEEGKKYYYIDNQGIPRVDTEDGHISDADRYEFGNYFRTKEQVEEAAKRVNGTLRKYHEEIKSDNA